MHIYINRSVKVISFNKPFHEYEYLTESDICEFYIKKEKERCMSEFLYHHLRHAKNDLIMHLSNLEISDFNIQLL